MKYIGCNIVLSFFRLSTDKAHTTMNPLYASNVQTNFHHAQHQPDVTLAADPHATSIGGYATFWEWQAAHRAQEDADHSRLANIPEYARQYYVQDGAPPQESQQYVPGYAPSSESPLAQNGPYMTHRNPTYAPPSGNSLEPTTLQKVKNTYRLGRLLFATGIAIAHLVEACVTA